MKITNERRKLRFQIVNTFLISFTLFLIFGVILNYPFIKNNIVYLSFLLVITYFFTKLRGYPFFTYDSEGEVLNFVNSRSNLILGINSEARKAEFPKEKLISFEIKNYFIKKILFIVIQSNRTKDHTLKLKFDITFLRKSEIQNLNKSLSKIIKSNKEKSKNQLTV